MAWGTAVDHTTGRRCILAAVLGVVLGAAAVAGFYEKDEEIAYRRGLHDGRALSGPSRLERAAEWVAR